MKYRFAFALAALLAGGLAACNDSPTDSDTEETGGDTGGDTGGSTSGSSKKCVVTGKYDGESCSGGSGGGGISKADCTELESDFADLRRQLGSDFTCKATWK